MLLASIHVQKAGGTCFLLKTLYKIARLEEMEACRLFAKEDSVMFAATETARVMSFITDLDGFTTMVGVAFHLPHLPSSGPKAALPPTQVMG